MILDTLQTPKFTVLQMELVDFSNVTMAFLLSLLPEPERQRMHLGDPSAGWGYPTTRASTRPQDFHAANEIANRTNSDHLFPMKKILLTSISGG